MQCNYWARWPLLFLLSMVTIFLTPHLLPRWMGLQWSAKPSQLCRKHDDKLQHLEMKLHQTALIKEGHHFVRKADLAYQCMKTSTENMWNGQNDRVKYPDECQPINARAETTSTEICFGGDIKRSCVNLFGIDVQCKTIKTQRKCETIIATDRRSLNKIAKINAQRQSLIANSVQNIDDDTRRAFETANREGELIINRLLSHIDIASNVYIIYVMIAIAIGRPLVIFKREIKSKIFAALLGVSKANFIIIVVLALTIYDSGVRIIRDANFVDMFRNFQADACYINPEFSRKRIQLIQQTCTNVSRQEAQLQSIFSKMTALFLEAQLCEVSSVDERGPTSNSSLVYNINLERQRFINGTAPGYIFPSLCNTTKLHEQTMISTSAKPVGALRAFLSTAILGQMLSKGVLTSFIIHLIGFIQPMSMHRGVIEVFGIDASRDGQTLTDAEQLSIIRFARDRHLLPLIISSMLLTFEFITIVYSFVQSKDRPSGHGILQHVVLDLANITEHTYSCFQAILLED